MGVRGGLGPLGDAGYGRSVRCSLVVSPFRVSCLGSGCNVCFSNCRGCRSVVCTVWVVWRCAIVKQTKMRVKKWKSERDKNFTK